MKKIYLLIGLLVVLGLTGCSNSNEDNTLLVYTSSGYAPYEMVDTDGNLEGFDIELMELLCDDLGYEIEWKDVDFSGIIMAVNQGQADCAIAGLNPSPDRATSVDFSDNYYENMVNVLVVLDGSDISMNNLAGKKIGTQEGTIQNTLLQDYQDELGYEIVAYQAYADMIQEIKAKRIDAMICEESVYKEIIKENDNLSDVLFTKEPKNTESGNAIAFPKGSELTSEFNGAIQKLKDDGTIDKLVAKWFED